METPYKDLEFSFLQMLIIHRLKYFKMEENKLHSKPFYNFLRIYDLLRYFRKGPLRYCILNEKGRMYLRYKRRSTVRFLIPTTISILALLGGYGVYQNPILKALLEAAMSLIENIMGSLGIFP